MPIHLPFSRRKLFLFIGLCLGGLLLSVVSFGQQATLSAGSTYIGPRGSLSFSLGQIAHTALTGSGGTLSQGVQQAYTVTPLQATGPDWLITAFALYPNPTAGDCMLRCEHYQGEAWTFVLYGSNGAQVAEGPIAGQTTAIGTGVLPAGTYFLKVRDLQKKNQISFKIIKY